MDLPTQGEGRPVPPAPAAEALPADWEAARCAWLAAKAPHTARTYQIAHQQFFAWAGVPPWQVTPELACAWGEHMAKAGLAARSIHLKLAALASFYHFVAQGDGRRAGSPCREPLWPAGRGNPFQGVPRPPLPPMRRAPYPSPGEARAILAAINTRCRTGRRDYALLLALVVTCRRPAEVLGLRWGDLEPLEGGDYACVYRSQAGHMRRANLSRAAYQAMCAYLEMDGRPPGRMRADDYIFVPMHPGRTRRLPGQAGLPLPANRPLSVGFANRIVKKYARRAGVERAKAHLRGLRRAAARLKLMGGFEI